MIADLNQKCEHPAREGRHEVYTSPSGSFCRACGARDRRTFIPCPDDMDATGLTALWDNAEPRYPFSSATPGMIGSMGSPRQPWHPNEWLTTAHEPTFDRVCRWMARRVGLPHGDSCPAWGWSPDGGLHSTYMLARWVADPWGSWKVKSPPRNRPGWGWAMWYAPKEAWLPPTSDEHADLIGHPDAAGKVGLATVLRWLLANPTLERGERLEVPGFKT